MFRSASAISIETGVSQRIPFTSEALAPGVLGIIALEGPEIINLTMQHLLTPYFGLRLFLLHCLQP